MKEAICDYCDAPLGCHVGSEIERRYWRTSTGLRICTACLLARCDDYADLQDDERAAALRLRYAAQWPSEEKVPVELWPGHIAELARDDGMSVKTIGGTIEAARGVIDPGLIRQAERELQQFFNLHRKGELLAALAAGRAAWNSGQMIHTMLSIKDDALRGRRSKRQRLEALEQRHRLAAGGFGTTADKHAAAVRRVSELRDSYPDKRAKVIYADVARMFEVSPGTVKNWCATANKHNPAP